MTAKVTLTAVDKSHGMSLVELRQNIDRAIEMGCTQIGRTRVGWNGQIQSIEVLEPKEESSWEDAQHRANVIP